MLLVDVALKVVCHGQQVSFTPLTINGNAAIEFAKQQLELSHIKNDVTLTLENNILFATFNEVAENLDENLKKWFH